MNNNPLIEILLRYLPHERKEARKCISFNCPCCIYMGESRMDSKGRAGLFIDHEKIGYNCFNCGFKFTQFLKEPLNFRCKKLMEFLNVPQSEINKIKFYYLKNNDNMLLNSFKQFNYKKNKISISKLNYKDCDLPSDTHFLSDIIMDANEDSDVFKAYSYAEDRGIHNWPFLMWSSSTSFKINKRLIVPFLFKDRIVGFTARSFLKNIPKKDRYYTNNPNTGSYIFGVENLFNKNRKYNILNESPIDSILYDGIASMNFEISTKQLEIINSSSSKIIVFPDLMNKGGQKMIDIAIRNNWSVYFPIWNKTLDLGEATQLYGKVFVLDNILKNHVSDKIKIKVKRNLFYSN